MQIYYGVMFLTDLILVCKPDLALRLFVCGKQLQRARSLISQGKASKARPGAGGDKDGTINMTINPSVLARGERNSTRGIL